MNPSLFSENVILVIGAGHFGARAVRILTRQMKGPILVVDHDASRLDRLQTPEATTILEDGVAFLVDQFDLLNDRARIVPAIPVHLSCAWLDGYLQRKGMAMRRVPIPPSLHAQTPHPLKASDGSLLTSYADFICPDDCPEPDACTVTGETRELPLFALLARCQVPLYRVHILRSQQIAPGLGGYQAGDLRRLATDVLDHPKGLWLLGTACKCHGILTACEIR